jgi:Nuclease-related domain
MLVGMLQSRRSRKAGASASRMYEDLTQAWLRRNRSPFLILAAVLALLVIGVNLAAARWSSLHWSAGLVTGVAIAMFMIARMSPPRWIANWQDGAVGEQWTGRTLRVLESQGWRIFHDLTASHGNIDHVAIGPGGVFLLDSKRWRGSVSVEGDSAIVRRLEDPDLHWRFTDPGHIKGLAVEVKPSHPSQHPRHRLGDTRHRGVGRVRPGGGGRHVHVRSWRRSRAVAQRPAGAHRPRPGGTDR